MMNLPDLLCQITASASQVQVSESHEALLVEPKEMQVRVTAIPSGSVILRLEDFELANLNQGNWLRCCDFVILNTQGKQLQALFVELKKTVRSKNFVRGCSQLRWSLSRLNYLISLCRLLNKKLRIGSVEARYVVVTQDDKRRLNKQSVRGRSNSSTAYQGIYVNCHTVRRNSVTQFQYLWQRDRR